MRTFCIGVDIAWWGGGKRHYARALHALLPRGRSALDQLRHLNIFAKKEESKTAEGFVVDSHPPRATSWSKLDNNGELCGLPAGTRLLMMR